MLKWSQGMIRLWLLFSALWVPSALYYWTPHAHFKELTHTIGIEGQELTRIDHIEALEQAAATARSEDRLEAAEVLQVRALQLQITHDRLSHTFKTRMFLVFMPSIILFAALFGGLWVVRGFVDRNKEK